MYLVVVFQVSVRSQREGLGTLNIAVRSRMGYLQQKRILNNAHHVGFQCDKRCAMRDVLLRASCILARSAGCGKYQRMHAACGRGNYFRTLERTGFGNIRHQFDRRASGREGEIYLACPKIITGKIRHQPEGKTCALTSRENVEVNPTSEKFTPKNPANLFLYAACKTGYQLFNQSNSRLTSFITFFKEAANKKKGCSRGRLVIMLRSTITYTAHDCSAVETGIARVTCKKRDNTTTPR